MRTVALAAPLLLAVFVQEKEKDETETITAVAYSWSGGGPIKPADFKRSVMKAWLDDDGTIRFISGRAGHWKEGDRHREIAGTLAREEWAAIVEVVHKHKLRDWKPDKKIRGTDTGPHSLTISAKGLKDVTREWHMPQPGSEGVDALWKALDERVFAKAVAIMSVGTISIHATPGEAGKRFRNDRPAEEIEAIREEKGVRLIVHVNEPRKGVTEYREEKADLTPEEFNALADVAVGLRDWKPGDDKAAPDWGEVGFRIVTTSEHAQAWRRPLDKDAAPVALIKAMKKTAATKAP